MENKTTVFSLGGSLIIPEEVDIEFLKNFKDLILEYIKVGNRAIVVCGGGRVCRKYLESVKKITSISDEDLDWIGIAATKLNAELARTIFSKDAFEQVVYDPTLEIKTNKKIIVASGYKPGNSSDKVAVMLAKKFGAENVINMTNIDKVYGDDPKINPNAKPIDKISWNGFLRITGEEWIPGKNTPFDPMASQLARDNDIKTIILNGKDLTNLQKFLNNQEFVGTTIG